jgi:hypothetical protein
MKLQNLGMCFRDYRQYCDLVDEAMAAFSPPLINGLPMSGDARLLIEKRRLSFVKNADHVLIFCAYENYAKLYYIAQAGAALLMPPSGLPIVADQVRLEDKPYPQYDALMAQSYFTLARVNVNINRKLDTHLNPNHYVHMALPRHVSVGFALAGEYFKINKLMRSAFDPLLDELPSRDELTRSINGGNVFVIRDREKIAAALIRIVRGYSVMLPWIAVDTPYRNRKLSGLLHYASDRDSQKKGYRHAIVWVNEKSEHWIRAVERRGYHRNKQRLYTYRYNS